MAVFGGFAARDPCNIVSAPRADVPLTEEGAAGSYDWERDNRVDCCALHGNEIFLCARVRRGTDPLGRRAELPVLCLADPKLAGPAWKLSGMV